MDVSILIISFNTRELTLTCLRTIFAQTAGVSFEVIVLDNASRDGSAEAVESEFPQVTVLRPGRNVGFAVGNNLAARHATGDYLLLLNPDTEILDRAVQEIVSFARRHPEAGIVGGRTFKADGTLDYRSCHGRPTPWSAFCLGSGLGSLFRRSRVFNPESLGAWRRDTVRRVDAVTGCFLLIGRPLWERLGGFDESFFMYGEDTDLCLRANATGAVCLVCPSARIVHHGAKSDAVRPDKVVRLFRAKAQLFHKHWRPAAVPLGVPLLDFYVMSRVMALGLLRWAWPSRAASGFAAWQEVWRRRSEYRPPASTERQDGAPSWAAPPR